MTTQEWKAEWEARQKKVRKKIGETHFQPRGDYVLVWVAKLGVTPTGIYVPELSIEGEEFYVLAVGEKVSDLKPGDQILCLGRAGKEYLILPNSKDIMLIREEGVPLVYRRSENEEKEKV